MPITITVDGTARAYSNATDPAYRKQLDRGDTKLAVAKVVPSTNMLLSGMSHALKTHAAAGNSGRRSTMSIKDETVLTGGSMKKDTVVVTAYHGYNDEDSEERCVALLAGQYTYLAADDFAEFRKLLRGGIEFTETIVV